MRGFLELKVSGVNFNTKHYSRDLSDLPRVGAEDIYSGQSVSAIIVCKEKGARLGKALLKAEYNFELKGDTMKLKKTFLKKQFNKNYCNFILV